jgi:hypothetical protein
MAKVKSFEEDEHADHEYYRRFSPVERLEFVFQSPGGHAHNETEFRLGRVNEACIASQGLAGLKCSAVYDHGTGEPCIVSHAL